MAWAWLGVAGLFEMVWAVLLKHTDGFSRSLPASPRRSPWQASFYCMSRALQAIPIGTVYAVWTGIGAAGAASGGLAEKGAPATAARVFCLALILAAKASDAVADTTPRRRRRGAVSGESRTPSDAARAVRTLLAAEVQRHQQAPARRVRPAVRRPATPPHLRRELGADRQAG
jgi:quaternary ammonium compound-resistance protein SugE